jgi:hypothetical protein
MFKAISAFLNENDKAAGAIASIVQSVAIVIAGIWLGWVFYYSEILKPAMSETFLLPKIELVKVGVEKDESGLEYYVLSLNVEVENKSGQKRLIASSFFIVNAYKFRTDDGGLAAADLQVNANSARGAVSRYRGRAPLSEVIYVGSELSTSRLAVGEKAIRSRLFRVPVGKFDQVEANWYVVSGTDLEEVDIAQVALKDITYDYAVGTCVCKRTGKAKCPDISFSIVADSNIQENYCKAPWYVAESAEGKKISGDPERNGKFTATSFFVMPPK